jgi:hypothetical protein
LARSSTGYSIITKRATPATRNQVTPPPPAIARSRASTPASRRTVRPHVEPPTTPMPPPAVDEAVPLDPPRTTASPATDRPLALELEEAAASKTAREPVPEESMTRAARSMVAARALDSALPSANLVMAVLAATGVVALVAAIVALV